MGRFNSFKETASFNSQDRQAFSPEGHLKLGHLTAGLFSVSSASIAQYARIKKNLLQVPGLNVLTYACHVAHVRLDNKILNNEKQIARLLNDIDVLKTKAKPLDETTYHLVAHTIERLTLVSACSRDSGSELAPASDVSTLTQ